jgi:hypothetical protein
VKIPNVIRVIMLGILPGLAFASGNTGSSQITQISVDMNAGLIYVWGTGTWGNPDGCPNSDYVSIPMAGNYKDLEAAVFTAYAAGKPMSFWVSTCNSVTSRPNVYGFTF